MPLKGTGHRLVGAKIASSVDNMETFCSHPAFLTLIETMLYRRYSITTIDLTGKKQLIKLEKCLMSYGNLAILTH